MEYTLITDDTRSCTLACVGSPETRCRDEVDGVVCTRAVGHDGPHIAHGALLQRLAYWGEGELPPLVERPEGDTLAAAITKAMEEEAL